MTDTQSQQPIHAFMAKAEPVCELEADNLKRLVEHTQVMRIPAGDVLIGKQQQAFILYLTQGVVELQRKNAMPEPIEQHTQRTMYPLFTEEDYASELKVLHDATFLKVDRNMFNALLEQELVTDNDSQQMRFNEVESNLFTEIMHAIQSGNLKLPSLPDLAIKIKTAVAHRDADVDTLVKIVRCDPALVARLIQVANSPLHQGVMEIVGIRDAIVRLGLKQTRDLVLTLLIRELFKTHSADLERYMHELYDHSIEIAAIACCLAKRSGRFDPDNAMLAGLIHDIGVIPLLAYIESTGMTVDSPENLEQVIEKLRPIVGEQLMQHWGFGDEFITLVQEAEHWQRDGGRDMEMVDLVNLAQIYSRLQRHELDRLPPVESIPAVQKLFHGQPDAGMVRESLKEAHQEIAETMALLNL